MLLASKDRGDINISRRVARKNTLLNRIGGVNIADLSKVPRGTLKHNEHLHEYQLNIHIRHFFEQQNKMFLN
jgi:hypothetical protein